MTTIDHIFFSFRAGANGLGIGLGIAVALIGVLLLLFTPVFPSIKNGVAGSS